jgi:2-methylcitrate dehydratase PrpD
MNRMTDVAPPEHALADYAARLTYADIEPGAARHVADLIFDTVGIAIGAFAGGHESGIIPEDHVLATVGNTGRGATLWSGRGTVPADQAALCNGTFAEVLDYQDTVVDPRNNGHAGVTIVPAAFAVAEREGRSGAELIAAVTAGLEVTIAVVRAVGRRHRSEGRGFRTTSIGAPLGAAVACGKLVRLGRDGLLNAMGLAGACAPNGLMPSLSPSNGSFGMDKDWVNGLAAQLGVNSADLAKRGMTASDRVVTGDRGIAASHAHGDAAALVAPKRGAPDIANVALKKYAACYGVHTAMEAASGLAAENGLSPGDIDEVVVRIKADSAVTLGGRTIANHMAARFSLPYAVASAVCRGSGASMHDFDEPAIHDAAVLAYMDRVRVVADPELTRFHDETGGFPAHVELHAGGKVHERRIDYPPGSFQRPMPRGELEAKFAELTEGRWPAGGRDAFVATAARMADLGDIRELTRLL